MNPAWYHGHHQKPPFFEGWYYKLINAAEDKRFAIIPGIFLSRENSKTHSFVQVLNGMTGEATYHRFESFEANRDAFDVHIDHSSFSMERINLNIDNAQGRVNGELTFKNMQPWPVTLTAPGAMGWYGWLPNMECNHGVISFDHEIQGSLTINDETIDFTGGHGYIEKDWGQSFPKGYIWLQTNHFESVGTSLTCSIGIVPKPVGGPFPGFTVGLMHKGALYKFGNFNNAKISELAVSDTAVEWHLYTAHHELVIHATRAEGGLLMGPEHDDMLKRVDETMKAEVDATLYALDGVRRLKLFQGHGRAAAMEVVNVNPLLELLKIK